MALSVMALWNSLGGLSVFYLELLTLFDVDLDACDVSKSRFRKLSQSVIVTAHQRPWIPVTGFTW